MHLYTVLPGTKRGKRGGGKKEDGRAKGIAKKITQEGERTRQAEGKKGHVDKTGSKPNGRGTANSAPPLGPAGHKEVDWARTEQNRGGMVRGNDFGPKRGDK